MKHYLFIVLILFLIGCNSEKNVPLEGTSTINSDLLVNPEKSEGFSIESGGIINYPNSDMIIPDFKLFIYYSSSEETVRPILASLTKRPSFFLIDNGENLDSAETSFNVFTDKNQDFKSPETFPVLLKNQVWLVRNHIDIYFKIQILEINTFNNDTIDDKNKQYSRFGNVTFKWKKL